MNSADEPVTISIRATNGRRDLIDQAAESVLRDQVHLDQVYFGLDPDRLAAFQVMLDVPPALTDRLRRTLRVRAPWEADRAGRKDAC